MPLEKRYLIALAVQALVEHDLDSDINVTVETFHNCRENGFAFSRYDTIPSLTVYVTQDRNSDDITVTPSKECEWSRIGDDYKKREYFKSLDKAAQRVLELLGNPQS